MADHQTLRTGAAGQMMSLASRRLVLRPMPQAMMAREELRAKEGASVSLKMPTSKREVAYDGKGWCGRVGVSTWAVEGGPVPNW